MSFFSDWKLKRMKRKLESLTEAAKHWRHEQRRFAIAAYTVPDMMVEPIRWGQLQNAANWAEYHYRTYQVEIKKLEQKIRDLEYR